MYPAKGPSAASISEFQKTRGHGLVRSKASLRDSASRRTSWRPIRWCSARGAGDSSLSLPSGPEPWPELGTFKQSFRAPKLGDSEYEFFLARLSVGMFTEEEEEERV